MTAVFLRSALCLLIVLRSNAFVVNTNRVTDQLHLRPIPTLSLPNVDEFPSSTALGAGDFTGAAQTLFGNMISPAAMLSGGLVPLGFLAKPLPADTRLRKKLNCIYFFLSVASLTNELLAIMYATVASNKLVELPSLPAESVFALIQRDYELPWLGCNVHFMFGLFGFVGMVLIRAFTLFPEQLNLTSAGLGASALMAMIGIVNVGAHAGDGRGNNLGGNIVSIVGRYVYLIGRHVSHNGGPMAIASCLLAAVSCVSATRNLLKREPANLKTAE